MALLFALASNYAVNNRRVTVHEFVYKFWVHVQNACVELKYETRRSAIQRLEKRHCHETTRRTDRTELGNHRY